MGDDVLRRVAEWLAGNDTGSSSETIAYWLGFRVRKHYPSVPHDPSDLGRCLRLLEAVPELRGDFGSMADLGDLWPTYVARWDEMAASMEQEVGIRWSKGRLATDTYKLMKQVEVEAYRAAGYEVAVGDDGVMSSATRSVAA